MGLRQERLGDEMRDLLASCFFGGQMNDPRLSGVTITHVRLTADLQLASVYYRLFDEGQKPEAAKGLESCSGFLRGVLAHNLKLRKTPELKFIYDESIETGSRIEKLLAQIKGEN